MNAGWLFAANMLATISIVPPAFAALAPQYQRIAELRAILNDERITGLFDSAHPIDRIERLKSDLYRLTGGACHVDVTIKDMPHGEPIAGPCAFILVAGPLICDQSMIRKSGSRFSEEIMPQ